MKTNKAFRWGIVLFVFGFGIITGGVGYDTMKSIIDYLIGGNTFVQKSIVIGLGVMLIGAVCVFAGSTMEDWKE